MTGFLLVLRLFKVYSVVSEWVRSDSPPLFVIPDSFSLYICAFLSSYAGEVYQGEKKSLFHLELGPVQNNTCIAPSRVMNDTSL